MFSKATFHIVPNPKSQTPPRNLAGVDVPTKRVLDGKNILPYMFGQSVDKPIHETDIISGATIRYEDWKLLVKAQKPGGGLRKGSTNRVPALAGSLFNLRDDLGESTDMSDQYLEKAADLKRMMESFTDTFKVQPRDNVFVK